MKLNKTIFTVKEEKWLHPDYFALYSRDSWDKNQ